MNHEQESEFESALKITAEVARSVAGDPEVWLQEASSTETRLIAWPRPKGIGYQQWLSLAFAYVVEMTLEAIGRAYGPDNVPPKDPADPEFQLILRVAQRVIVAVDAALIRELGGVKLSGIRDFRNRFAEALADEAVRSGGNRADAFAAVGISKAAAYRAMKRSRSR